MFPSAPANAVYTINEYNIFSYDSNPWAITAGPDGNLWFTESGVGSKIGRITTAGVLTEFPIPTALSKPTGITAGPDGNLWFTEYYGNKIGRITTAGVITEFPIPTPLSEPTGITAGPDGNLWVTENYGNKIGRITTAGVITEFSIPTPLSYLYAIAAGPDGNLWFTEYYGNKIGRITTAGVITEFSIPTALSEPYAIAAGPDGNLWFTEYYSNKIGRITTAGVITEFPIPTASSLPNGITAGPDGNIWFTEQEGDKIGRITTAGVITELPIPTASSSPNGITAGPDGNIWFIEQDSDKIGQIVLANVPETNWTLSVSTTDAGSGTVTSNSGTIVWNGDSGTVSYNSGSIVSLTATANSDFTFTGWSGACSSQSSSATCVIKMNTAESVSAHYIITGTPSFNDVSIESTYESYIEAIYNNGITTGCGKGSYCPSEEVTRDQMAAFIMRAWYGLNFDLYAPTPYTYTSTPYFSDVPATDYYFKFIQKLKDLGITTMSGTYLPSEVVTRDQMAAFLVRAIQSKAGQDTENFTYTSTPYFTDVPATDTYFKYIQKLKDLGITTMSGIYLPTEDVTRDQMAAFLARAFLGMK